MTSVGGVPRATRAPGAMRAVLIAVPVLRTAVRRLRADGLTEALVAMAAGGPSKHPIDAAGQARIARSIGRASRLVRGADCLPQAIATAAMLSARGETPEVVLGCRRSATGDWLAHAWVTVGESVLPQGAADGFTELARCRAASGWSPAPVRAENEADSGPGDQRRITGG